MTTLATLLPAIHARAKAVASVARLPLRTGRWSGVSGSVLGQGTGNSLDFQDQRPYLPGDDPRHINWQAYARSGHYTMKLYQQEVTPRVDLLFDASASMFLPEGKAQRTWELLYWCLENALRLGASIKLHQLGSAQPETPLERALAYDWEFVGSPAGRDPAHGIMRCALRPGSLRILLSDLLHETAPDGVLTAMMQGRGRGMILAPYCIEEEKPDWSGNMEFVECETHQRDKRRVDSATLARYHRAYALHFSLWRDACARRGLNLARVPSEGQLLAALRGDAVNSGCVVM
ncbi:MAG: DUF58 domain-containing protein [Roseimicrobium sp.]